MKSLSEKLKFFILIIFILFSACTTSNKEFHLQTGDLLFQVGKSSGLNEAIAGVTFGESEIHYTHVGIVFIENDTVFIIEAIPPEVCITSLDMFLQRSAKIAEKSVVAVGRLKKEYRETIPQAIIRAKTLLGKPYDYVYSPDYDAFYCSELILYSFLTIQNKPVFEPVSMNFRDPDGNLPVYWIAHFEKYGADIPENQPGSNPGDLSRSDKLDIVYRYF